MNNFMVLFYINVLVYLNRPSISMESVCWRLAYIWFYFFFKCLLIVGQYFFESSLIWLSSSSSSPTIFPYFTSSWSPLFLKLSLIDFALNMPQALHSCVVLPLKCFYEYLQLWVAVQRSTHRYSWDWNRSSWKSFLPAYHASRN